MIIYETKKAVYYFKGFDKMILYKKKRVILLFEHLFFPMISKYDNRVVIYGYKNAYTIKTANPDFVYKLLNLSMHRLINIYYN